jgi:hypothetical protein
MTSKDKRVSKNDIHASLLERARRLYKSGSKVFDERYLKDIEEGVLKESKFIGLSPTDIEEVLQVRHRVEQPNVRELLKEATQEVEKALSEERDQITHHHDKTDKHRFRGTAAIAEEYLEHQRRIIESLELIWKPFLESDMPDMAISFLASYANIVTTTIEGMVNATRLANSMFSSNTQMSQRTLRSSRSSE